MNARVLLVTRFQDLSMKVAGSNRDVLTIVHVAWLSDAIRRLAQSDFQAVMVDLDLPDAKGLEGLQRLARIAPHLPILVLGDDPVFLTPLLSGEPLGNRRTQGAGRAPPQNEPLASGQRQSSLYPGQHRPWRSRSATPRTLS
jgi:hypothetical protein